MIKHFKNYYLFYIVLVVIVMLSGGFSVLKAIYQESEQLTSVQEIQEPLSQDESVLGQVEAEPEAEPEPQPKADPPVVVEVDLELEPEPETYYTMLKDVGEPYLYRFGLGPADFRSIKEAGIDIIESNFDICASPSDVLMFLEGAKDAGLKVIMPAGAGEAEWGYPCDEVFSNTLKPEWQKETVQTWVKKWAWHPAIYAWDISNEDGQNFPNAQLYEDDWVERGFSVSIAQLQQAYRDVKEADPVRPIMIRMNGWYFYDYDSNFFRAGNVFGPNVADIVMVNAYSNVDEYFSDLVTIVASRTHDSVRVINPNAEIIVAIGAWEEPPMWFEPTLGQFKNDIEQAKKTDDLLGIAVFKYGAEEGEWLMPKDAPELWNAIKSGSLR